MPLVSCLETGALATRYDVPPRLRTSSLCDQPQTCPSCCGAGTEGYEADQLQQRRQSMLSRQPVQSTQTGAYPATTNMNLCDPSSTGMARGVSKAVPSSHNPVRNPMQGGSAVGNTLPARGGPGLPHQPTKPPTSGTVFDPHPQIPQSAGPPAHNTAQGGQSQSTGGRQHAHIHGSQQAYRQPANLGSNVDTSRSSQSGPFNPTSRVAGAKSHLTPGSVPNATRAASPERTFPTPTVAHSINVNYNSKPDASLPRKIGVPQGASGQPTSAQHTGVRQHVTPSSTRAGGSVVAGSSLHPALPPIQ